MTIKGIKEYIKSGRDLLEEIIWSNIWHDAIEGVEWLHDIKGIVPGKMAVGYNYIYIMTRILDEVYPEKVLDLGLGVSSTLISKYFSYMQNKKEFDLEHLVIEHDKSWINFYTNKHELSGSSYISQHDLVLKEYQGDNYYAYDDSLKELLSGRKFSVISVDGPFGYLMKNNVAYQPKYVRHDIVDYLPELLEDDFVIVYDDYDTIGVKNTVSEIRDILNGANISYNMGLYYGHTHCCVIASEKYRFLCSV